MSRKGVLLCFVFLVCAATASFAEEKSLNRIVSERLIAQIDNLIVKKDAPILRVSPDGKRVAYISGGIEGKETVVVDEKKQKEYSAVSLPIFSPDSQRVAYVANTGGKQVVVLDGEEQKRYESVKSLVFSLDSKRLMYVARRGDKFHLVVDGKEEKGYYYIMFEPMFSADGRHVAYVAADEGKQSFVVVDKEEGKRFDKSAMVVLPAFSPDGKRVAYIVAVVGGKWFAVIDEKEGRRYDGITAGPYFSLDSKRVAYIAISVEETKKWFVVVDGMEEGPYDVVGSISFSPDGKHVAYPAVHRGVNFVVVDGKQKYSGGSIPPIFSPDSKNIAYGDGLETLVHGVAVHKVEWVAINGKKQKHYDAVVKGTLIFSPDSSQVAYIAIAGGKQLVVVDGKEGKPYDEIVSTIIFDSPDSLHYLAKKGSGIYLVEEKVR